MPSHLKELQKQGRSCEDIEDARLKCGIKITVASLGGVFNVNIEQRTLFMGLLGKVHFGHKVSTSTVYEHNKVLI